MASTIIIAFLFAIVVALGAGMVFLVRDNDRQRTVRALTWRIGLSLALIAFLVLCYWQGWIHPHGIRP